MLLMLLSMLLLAAPARKARAAARKPPAGARTVLLPSPANPLVAVRLYFDVGADDDPKGKEGLASLTAAMLGEGGTKERTYAEVLDALYPMAARIRYYGDKDSVVFEGTVHRDNLAAFAELLAAQILEPRFSPRTSAATSRTASTTSPRPCGGTTTRTWASKPSPR
jgi:zinc protease